MPPVTHCCFLFPIRCGLVALGYLSLINVVYHAIHIVKIYKLMSEVAPLFCLVYLIFFIGQLYIMYKFISYMQEDTLETRFGLVNAMKIDIAFTFMLFFVIMAYMRRLITIEMLAYLKAGKLPTDSLEATVTYWHTTWAIIMITTIIFQVYVYMVC